MNDYYVHSYSMCKLHGKKHGHWILWYLFLIFIKGIIKYVRLVLFGVFK